MIALMFCLLSHVEPPRRPLPRFERVVIDDAFANGYQVEVADVDGDTRPDLVALGGATVAWYHNPDWTKRVITDGSRTPGVISSATGDFDGDGRVEVFIAYEFAMTRAATGKLAVARPPAAEADPWSFEEIAALPSIHRVRLGDFDADGRPELIAAPLLGAEATSPADEEAPAEIRSFRRERDAWTSETIGRRPVLHAIDVIRGGDGDRLLTADNLGVAEFRRGPDGWQMRPLTSGAAGPVPKRGSSEIHRGQFADGTPFLATIDPWHGQQVVIHRMPPDGHFQPTVIDAQLGEGHALWVADVDADGDDEIFAGDRGARPGVTAYDWDGRGWVRTLLDPAIAAQDLRGGDLDGDGRLDLVAIGGRTANLVWYRTLP